MSGMKNIILTRDHESKKRTIFEEKEKRKLVKPNETLNLDVEDHEKANLKKDA